MLINNQKMIELVDLGVHRADFSCRHPLSIISDGRARLIRKIEGVVAFWA
jgi:hypothetical protein